MISSTNYKDVFIHISTYSKAEVSKTGKNMNEETKRCRDKQNTKFICSICLNTKPANTEDCINIENTRKKSKSCPICQRVCHVCDNISNEDDRAISKTELDSVNSKTIQTSNVDVAQGLNLLNEVLTVFKSKKQKETQKVKSPICKDAAVSTEITSKPQLSVSKIFHLSIDEANKTPDGKFTIVNSVQPIKLSEHFKVDLTKHKSSSVPQMKIDQLKNSLKEKTKSKDAIEEVNRMFATVRKNVRDSVEDSNRPLVRNGPRVLPVVKTKNLELRKESMENVTECSERLQQFCQCCNANYFLSSGDSKRECCQKLCEDKCVYMLCCHSQERRRMICERCRNISKPHFGHINDTCDSF